jgi:hypothetical protein
MPGYVQKAGEYQEMKSVREVRVRALEESQRDQPTSKGTTEKKGF